MLLTNLTAATMKDGYGLIEDAAILIEGGRIAWVGPRADLPATGASRHLREQLENPLSGAEVRQMQPEIGVDDAKRTGLGYRHRQRGDGRVGLPLEGVARPADGQVAEAAGWCLCLRRIALGQLLRRLVPDRTAYL